MVAGHTSIEMPPGLRRMPVYLMLDTSGSMNGTGIESLKQGIAAFVDETRNNPLAWQTVHVDVIEFNTEAKSLTDGLIPISNFVPPQFQATGVTRLDKALDLVAISMDRDLLKPKKGLGGSKGDYKPLVFILTDGAPTDDSGNLSNNWIPARDRLIQRPKGAFKPSTIMAVGCGMDIQEDLLQQIITGPGITNYYDIPPDQFEKTRDIVGFAKLMGKDATTFIDFFRWLSQSLSTGIDGQAENPGIPPSSSDDDTLWGSSVDDDDMIP